VHNASRLPAHVLVARLLLKAPYLQTPVSGHRCGLLLHTAWVFASGTTLLELMWYESYDAKVRLTLFPQASLRTESTGPCRVGSCRHSDITGANLGVELLVTANE
jgi:hypothetical protein